MKKLLLILSAILVSITGWAQNPFVYDLTSSWNKDTKKLTVNFKLNAEPNLNNSLGGVGVQIYVVDSKNAKYYIKGLSKTEIWAKTRVDGKESGALKHPPYSYSFAIDLSSGLTADASPREIPKNVPLSAAVGVSGVKNATTPTASTLWQGYNRLYSVHGITIDTVISSPTFGRVFATEGKTHSTNSYISYNKGTGIFQFNSGLIYEKHWNSPSNTEPIRVRHSEDGRLFACSFTSSTPNDVWEINKSTGAWTSFITRHSTYGDVVGMDVKGKDSAMKILLCYLNKTNNRLSFYEYSNSTKQLSHILDQNITADENTYFQGNWTVNISYGNQEDDFWVSYETNYETYSQLKNYRKLNGIWTAAGNYHPIKEDDNTGKNTTGGAGGLLVHDNLLVKAAVHSDKNTYLHFFTIGKNTEGKAVLTQKYSPLKVFAPLSSGSYCPWINDMAIDHVSNIYMTSAWYARMNIAALPYDGRDELFLPKNENNTFELSTPIPNILATDLRFAPVPKQPKYRFSFNVNTKPAVAQIRFYKSYGDGGENDMKKNLAKINADDYQGGDAIKPSFVYNIPEGLLKQGEISVSLGMCGGKLSGEIGSEDCKITNDSLPRGEWYWSVYVEAPRKSNVFAPIYEQSTSGEDAHHRLHATVNNYPETDGFGHIYAVNYYAELDTKNGLMDYTINPDGNSNDEQNNIKNSNRYKLVKNYLNPTGNKPKFTNQRRLVVAPDGKVYIADCGQSLAFDAKANRPWMFQGGGVFVWNPNTQTGNEIQISLFSTKDRTSTATGIDIYNDNGQLKLYATNTYGEFENHYTKKLYWKGNEYTEENQENTSIYGWNGFKEFNLGTPDNILLEETNGTKLYSLGMGDGNGNIGIVATDKGVWMAQHRLNDVQYTIDQFKNGVKNPALPDNTENYILSFVPYNSNTRTWKSCTTRGINYDGSKYDQKGASELTQLPSSPLQACPGAGLAYRKTNGKEYLYIVNHQGNIVELQITSWDGTKPSVQYTKTYPGAGPKEGFQNTGRLQGVINSMCFDYAGNLITTSGLEYLGSTSNQNIIVYTMPYDRVNAREIQAPNSCRFIPERTAYLEPRSEMELTLKQYIEGTPKTCYLDIFRPMPNTSFSTICLPFDLDMKQLTTEALKDAEVKQYKGLKLSDIGGEKMLELVFEDIPTEGGKQILKANTPYIIQPKVRIPGIIQLQNPIQFVAINEQSIVKETQDKEYAITFKGVIPTQQIEVNQPLTLLLVAENRLAEMIPDEGTTGQIHGFRGYFELNKPLNAIGARITSKQSVSTSTTIIVDGKRVNIKKYLREGRVYIRMGDTLYTIDGQKVQ